MNQENDISKCCKVKYLSKAKTSVDLVEFDSQSPIQMSVFLVALNNLVYHQNGLLIQVNQ